MPYTLFYIPGHHNPHPPGDFRTVTPSDHRILGTRPTASEALTLLRTMIEFDNLPPSRKDQSCYLIDPLGSAIWSPDSDSE